MILDELVWLLGCIAVGGGLVWRSCDLILDDGRWLLGSVLFLAGGACGGLGVWWFL